MNSDVVLETKKLFKSYMQGNQEVAVLQDINLVVKPSSMIALMGPSGSGKSSLLNILGMLDTPTSGEVFVQGINVSTLNDKEQTTLRGKNIGFMFQFHHLLPDFSALENVMLPLQIQGISKEVAKQQSLDILNAVGLSARVNSLPNMLSGGEQQRVSFARAVVFKPSIIIADEPTGNLDEKVAQDVLNIMLSLVQEHRISIIIATHDTDIANQIPIRVKLHNHQLVEF